MGKYIAIVDTARPTDGNGRIPAAAESAPPPICGQCGPGDRPVQDDAVASSSLELIELHAHCVAALGIEQKEALARELELPSAAIEVLDIGWWVDRDAWLRDEDPPREAGRPGCWTFPERNADGELAGLSLRFPLRDGAGHAVRSHEGKRGLTLPADWRDLPDPVVCVEGPSDVLAGRLLSINCIGRPSNSGGADLIATACRGRKLIILGENDRKPDGTWPGRDGARNLVRKLQQAWNRPPHRTFPPEGRKDLRDWVLHRLRQAVANPQDKGSE